MYRLLLGTAIAGLISIPMISFGQDDGPETIRVRAQSRPGGEIEEFDMPYEEVPVDPPMVLPYEVSLASDELVLGVALDGETVAFPIRFLALSEVVNARVGKTPVAPTW